MVGFRSHTKCRLDQIPDGNFSCSFYICISCFQSYQILYILNLKFCVVFDRYDAFIFGYILR